MLDNDIEMSDLLTTPPPGMGRVVSVMRMEVLDSRTCEICAYIDGMILDINDPRVNLYNQVHPNCRGDWAYMTDEMHPQVTQPDFVNPPPDMIGAAGGPQFEPQDPGAFIQKKGDIKMPKEEAPGMDDELVRAIKKKENELGKNIYAESIGVNPQVWDKMTYADKTEIVQVLKKGNPDPKQLNKIIRQNEDVIRKQKDFETAVAIDKNGKIVLNKKGGADYVVLDESDMANINGKTFTHNHPSSRSFSPEDITTAGKANLKEMRVTSEKYEYVLKRDKGLKFNENYVDKIMKKHAVVDNIVENEFWAKINMGEMTAKTADLIHQHTVMERLLKFFPDLIYKRGLL